MGLAISGMHYTAMAGMRLDPICYDPAARFVEASGALSRNTLALLATVIAFGVSGAFLLSLVPETSAPGGVRPLPRLRRRRRGDAARTRAAAAAAGRRRRPAPRLRVEKDGRARDLPLDRVCAVRANAHYTYIHDGETEFFCNQPISALEATLDAGAFMRVHRSHIVRIAAVTRWRRHGDAADARHRRAGAVQHSRRAHAAARGEAARWRRKGAASDPSAREIRQQI